MPGIPPFLLPGAGCVTASVVDLSGNVPGLMRDPRYR